MKTPPPPPPVPRSFQVLHVFPRLLGPLQFKTGFQGRLVDKSAR